jgi:hypothetical protein
MGLSEEKNMTMKAESVSRALPFLLACFFLPGSAMQIKPAVEEAMTAQLNAETIEHDPQTDFDFIIGSWKVHNRRLKQRLKGSILWEEFEGTVVARKIWGGAGNIDEFEAESPSGRIQGMTVRLYNPKSQQWSLYWANRGNGVLETPMIGGFKDGRGEFYDQELFEGKSIYVRYIWSNIKADSARWEQAFSADGGKSWETNWIMDFTRSKTDSTGQQTKPLKDFQVIEFRRYKIKGGERESFARYFETYFPEAFQQMGSIIFGQFLERRKQDRFTWIRGFHDMEARKTLNQGFYTGPLWKEHAATMNLRIEDIADVMLLRPLSPEREIVVLPAIDPVNEANGAQGVVVAQIFAVNAGKVEDFARKAEETFAGYRTAGVREAGVLITLDAPNNFPGLPVREDGPYLVWLGILKDNQILEKGLSPLVESASSALFATGLLREAPEFLILDPTSRSRLRWLPEKRK